MWFVRACSAWVATLTEFQTVGSILSFPGANRMRRPKPSVRIVSTVCVGVFLLCTVASGPAVAEELIDLDPEIDLVGNGTELEPYLIDNAFGLQSISNEPTANYTLTADIDATNSSNWNDGAGFSPIGTDSQPFTGSFDGNGYVIQNLVISVEQAAMEDDGGDAAPFNRTHGATFSNVRLYNATVSAGNGGFATGTPGGDGGAAGGLVVVLANGTITDSQVEQSTVTAGTGGSAEGPGGNGGAAGGLAAVVEAGTISGSVVSESTITAGDGGSDGGTGNEGGDGGMSGGMIGTVVGGAVDDSVVTRSNTTSGSGGSGVPTGVVGSAGGVIAVSTTTTVTSSASTGGTISTGEEGVFDPNSGIGGLVGYITDEMTVVDANATSTVDGRRDHVGGLIGYNNGGNVNGAYATGAVSGSGLVGGLIGNNSGQVTGSFATSSTEGDSHLIGGLVGRNDNGLINTSHATGPVSGVDRVGGLVGSNIDGEVHESYANGTVIGSGNLIGGLVGWSSGSVSNSYALGDVTGTNRVGGLFGYNRGDVQTSYAAGSVDGSSDLGGLVGRNYIGTVNDSYWDAATTNRSIAVADTEGTTNNLQGFGDPAESGPTAEMQGASAETALDALDFAVTWQSVTADSDGDAGTDGYPILQSGDRDRQLAAQLITAGEDVDGDDDDSSSSSGSSGSSGGSSGSTDDSEMIEVDAKEDDETDSSAESDVRSSSTTASVSAGSTLSILLGIDDSEIQDPDETEDDSDGIDDEVADEELEDVDEAELEDDADETEDEADDTEPQVADSDIGERPPPVSQAEVETIEIDVNQDTDAEIEIRQSRRPPSADAQEFQRADGTQAAGYVQVTNNLDPDAVDGGRITYRMSKEDLETDDADPENVAMYYFNTESEQWNELPTEIVGETDSHVRFRADTPGFSQFASGIKRAQFEVSNATVNVQEVTLGNTVRVEAIITNTGGADGTFRTELVVDDEVVEDDILTIAAGGTRATLFDHEFTQPDTYEVRVNDVSTGEITVIAPASIETDDTESFIPGFGVGAAVVSLLVASLAVWRRQK